jgi:AcrR family transcriptional regulator
MSVPPGGVKRRYNAARRRARAEQTRRDVLAVALRRFLEHGYAATTVAAIAADASVSVETIYKGFGGKPQLVMALFHDAIAGDAEISTEARADRVSQYETDPVRKMHAFGRFVAEVMPRVGPLMLLVRAAADSHPELADVWSRMNTERLARMTEHARRLSEHGHLRLDITVAEARDVLWLYSAPDLYDLLVRQRGWSLDRYGDWIGRAYVAALLPPQHHP